MILIRNFSVFECLNERRSLYTDLLYMCMYIYIYEGGGVVFLSVLFELKGKITEKAREFANTGAVFIC